MPIPYNLEDTMYRTLIVCSLALLFLFAGCGKSADQLKMEGDLSKEITTLHDGLMAKMPQVKELLTNIPELMAQGQELAKKYPKAAELLKVDALKGASEQLVKAQSAMEAWMKGFKPYDLNMKHDEVMTTLTKQKEELTKMKGDFDTAVTGATATVDTYKKTIADLMAKVPAKKK
jgi:hypothetical protein